MVSAQVSESDFAALLDQRIKRFEEAKKLIEHQPLSPPAEPPPAPVKAPLAHTIDRRYRRV
jgi:hypothetical protein